MFYDSATLGGEPAEGAGRRRDTMNIAQGWKITEANGTEQEIAELANKAIADATKTGCKGLTLWVHNSKDERDLVPMVTVEKEAQK